ncbi:MAG TPA: hypothetical protein VL285_13130 [Bryobacteraceae bacterium]|nr:hypothetical protein [Bryobacteraceae bacterium]
MPNQQQWIFTTLLAFSAAGALPGLAQEQQPNTGWRRVGDPVQQADEAPPVEAPAPHTLVVPAGTWITVRMNQHLSSDRNQQGDPFTATLAQPVVANGRVIARRGQTVGGIVADAQKAGHVKGTSRLGLQLTELSLADGRQVQIGSKLTERNGNTSVGSDAAAIGATTGLGAAIGGAVDGGFGAGMGAIGGAVVSTIGVLATRGRATEVYPEQPLTFRLETPITVAAEYAEAYPPVMQEDYEQQAQSRPAPTLRYGRPVPPPYYYGGYYPYYYGPGFYGPSFYFYSGRGFYGRGHYRRW